MSQASTNSLNWSAEWERIKDTTDIARLKRFAEHAHPYYAALAGDRMLLLEAEAISLRYQTIKDRLLEKGWKLNFQPRSKGGIKSISFNKDGTIGEGQSKNEHRWRWNGNILELISESGSVNNRFEYDSNTNRFISNQPSAAYNIRGQFIYRD